MGFDLASGLVSGGLGLAGGIGGAYLTSKSNDRATDKNIAIQRELAKNGLSWRVEDARKSGINPLAALGASLPSGNPVAVGTDYGDLGLGAAGQEISRAMQAQMTKEQREMHELNKKMLQVQIEGQEIENRNKLVGTPPPRVLNPSPSNPLNTGDYKNNPKVKVIPNEIIATDPRGVEAGVQPLHQFTEGVDGYGDFNISDSKSDLLESDTILYIQEQYRKVKNILESWRAAINPEQKHYYQKRLAEKLYKIRPMSDKKGYEWRYDMFRARWKLSPIVNGQSHIFTTPMKDMNGVKIPMPKYKPYKKGKIK